MQLYNLTANYQQIADTSTMQMKLTSKHYSTLGNQSMKRSMTK